MQGTKSKSNNTVVVLVINLQVNVLHQPTMREKRSITKAISPAEKTMPAVAHTIRAGEWDSALPSRKGLLPHLGPFLWQEGQQAYSE